MKVIDGEGWEKIAIQQDLDESTQSALIKEIHAVSFFSMSLMIVGRDQESEREGN